MFSSKKFDIRLLGLSSDLRTNKWRFICKKCQKAFSPQTTMLAKQGITCPTCREEELINYNEL